MSCKDCCGGPFENMHPNLRTLHMGMSYICQHIAIPFTFRRIGGFCVVTHTVFCLTWVTTSDANQTNMHSHRLQPVFVRNASPNWRDTNFSGCLLLMSWKSICLVSGSSRLPLHPFICPFSWLESARGDSKDFRAVLHRPVLGLGKHPGILILDLLFFW